MLNIKCLMTDLAKCREVFHSEADFQHALAWHIHETMPKSQIRLEFPVSAEHRKMYVDIWLPVEKIAIELKYVTRGIKLKHKKESFALRDQRAQNQRRYDFLRDIHRLERMRRSKPVLCEAGFAVLLTNDPSYWECPSPRSQDATDADFRIHDGQVISEERDWATHTSPGTKKGRECPIQLEDSYCLHWQDYSKITEKPRGKGKSRGKFRYLAVTVD